MDTGDQRDGKHSVKGGDLHKQFMEQYDAATAAVREDRERMESEIEFIHKRGGQWDDWAKKARGKRPKPEINLTNKRLEVVKGNQKRSRIDAKIRATGGGARDKVANVFDGLVRAITSNSRTHKVRSSAFEEAVDCGLGAYYIDTDYESDESFNIEPAIKEIRNARSTVHWLVGGSDGQHRDSAGCFVESTISRSDFKQRWPSAKAGDESFKGKNGPHSGWSTRDTLKICDHWRREPYTRTLGQFKDSEGNENVYEVDEDTLKVVDEMAEEGIEPVLNAKGEPRTKTVRSFEVLHYVLSGSEILEGPNKFPCSMIPVCMVYGYEYWNKDGRHPYGMATFAIDPQRKLNYEAGAQLEASAKAAKDPWLATKKQINPYKRMWSTQGAENPEVLWYEPDERAQSKAPFRGGAPAMQNAIAMQMQNSEAFLHGAIGVHSASVGENPNAQSGRALLALQESGDDATFTIRDGLANAVAYETECLIDMLPKILDHETQLRILKDDEEAEEVQLVGDEFVDSESGNVVRLKDFRLPKYDVTVTIGPSTATKRIENLQILTQLAGQMPIFNELAPDIIAGELDITKSRELTERIKNFLIKRGIKDPTDEEAKAMFENMQKQQQMQQLLQPKQNQQSEQELRLLALQDKKFENEILKEGADIDKTVSERVKDLTDSLEKLQSLPDVPNRDAILQGITFEIQQALTSNDPQPAAVAQTAIPKQVQPLIYGAYGRAAG